MKGCRAWAEVDLAALRHNVSVVRRAAGPRPEILAVVKADAYGHGAPAVAWTALDAGCARLGVGDSSEALELREAGLAAPILILGAIIEEEIPRVVQNDITVTVHSADLLDALDAEARRRNRLLRVHLKVDTGLARLGCSPARALDVARAVLDRPNLRLEGLSTHFSSAGNPDVCRGQLDRFRAVADELARDGIQPDLLHAANSVAVFTCPESHFDLVRPGIALYGLDPGPFATLGLPLRPVLSLKTRITYLKGVGEGVPVGYGEKHVTAAPARIATCAAGYSDGYRHSLGNRAEAVVRGRRVPVVGSVSMDYITLDVTSVPEVSIDDEVTLIGAGVRVEELARKAGTIPYEITCGLGRRVKRIPANASQAVPAAFRVVA